MLPSEISVPKWFSDPNYRDKYVGSMELELVTENKEMNKLDALHLKKYYQYFIKQNRNKGLEHLRKHRMYRLEHLSDNHELCDISWCEKKT